MSLFSIYRKLRSVGPVTIGTGHNRQGITGYIAACGAVDCGWSAHFDTYAAAAIAAEGHRCPVR